MNAQVASIRDGLSFRQIFAFDILRWNLRLGFAVAPRDVEAIREQRRLRRLRSVVPGYLHEDIGLPREEVEPIIAMSIQSYFARW